MFSRVTNRLPACIRLRLTIFLSIAIAWASMPPPAVYAFDRGVISIAAAPEVILADGSSKTILTATVRTSDGNMPPDGSTVQFNTSLGILDHNTASTISGVARVTLTSAASPGMATVTATAILSGRSATGSADVEFTSDRDAVYSTGDSRWIKLECPQDLLYSADTKIIQAHGKNGSVHLEYHGIDISADSLQIDLASPMLPVLAHNAHVKRGHASLTAAELSFSLENGTGSAVVPGTGRTAFTYVSVAGLKLTTAPLDPSVISDAIKNNLFRFQDMSGSSVIVTARAISVNPTDEIQFRRAGIYSDGKRVLSMPYHVMAMDSKALFGQQLFGFGSQGFFVNVPIYYHVSPNSLGTLYIRNSAVAGADPASIGLGAASAFGQYGTRPGISLDLVHTYSFGDHSNGTFSVDGLSNPDWVAHWNHNQRINDATNGYMYVDYAAHRSQSLSTGLTRDFKKFALNIAANGTNDPGFDGYSASSRGVSAALITKAEKLGHSGINFTTNFTIQRGQRSQSTPTSGKETIPISTRSVGMQFSTNQLKPAHNTTLINSLSIGQSWNDQGQNSPTAQGSVRLNRTHLANGQLSVNYTCSYDPLLSDTTFNGVSDPLATLYRSAFQQNITFFYNASLQKRLSLQFNGNFGLTVHASNLSTGIQYALDKNWGVGLYTLADKYGDISYHETQIQLSRKLFGRTFVLEYSTKTKKVHFDVDAIGLH